mmetsp:Transcript_63098/g.148626  ORF Transcript_63098/g.148626 Transcript_63098/m.148626 type:complete len:206 (-) Transcript_63098:320-937(-)
MARDPLLPARLLLLLRLGGRRVSGEVEPLAAPLRDAHGIGSALGLEAVLGSGGGGLLALRSLLLHALQLRAKVMRLARDAATCLRRQPIPPLCELLLPRCDCRCCSLLLLLGRVGVGVVLRSVGVMGAAVEGGEARGRGELSLRVRREAGVSVLRLQLRDAGRSSELRERVVVEALVARLHPRGAAAELGAARALHNRAVLRQRG